MRFTLNLMRADLRWFDLVMFGQIAHTLTQDVKLLAA